MPTNILMPALSPTMTEGNLAKWHKNEGDAVKAGEVIAEIETDKATMEVEAVDEGKIGKILIAAGTQGVAVNTPIAILLEEGENDNALKDVGSSAKPQDKPVPQNAEASPKTMPALSEDRKAGMHQATPMEHKGDRVFATPLAKRIAQDCRFLHNLVRKPDCFVQQSLFLIFV